MSKFDVIIVGAGIVGVSTAYHLKQDNPDKKILLVDKMSAAGQGDTARSTQCFRNLYSSPIKFNTADSSIDFYNHIQNDLKYDLGLQQVGSLWLFSNEQYASISDNLERVAKMGVEMKIYEKLDLAKMLEMKVDLLQDEEAKMMGLSDVDKGVLCVKGGNVDTDKLVGFYEAGYKELKGETLYNTQVKSLVVEPEPKLGIHQEPFSWQDSKITGITTNRGNFDAEKTILTTGAWTGSLLDPMGMELHTKVWKPQCFSIKAGNEELKKLLHSEGFNRLHLTPNIILPPPKFGCPLFIKVDNTEESFWVDYAPHTGVEFKLYDDPQAHENYFNYGASPVLTKYFPQFVGMRPSSMWAGQIVCMPTEGDYRMLVAEGLLVVVTMHGIMHGDSLGRISTALYSGKNSVQLYGGRNFDIKDLVTYLGKPKPESPLPLPW
jgi:glycine/D-amino acid oxidase-like deaminating enzyme